MVGLPGASWDRQPSFGTKVNRSHPLARGLAGLWAFNEGGGPRLRDASGNRVATATAVPAWRSARTGMGVKYDTTFHHTYDSITFGTSPITAFAVLKFTSVHDGGIIGGGNGGFAFRYVSGPLQVTKISVANTSQSTFSLAADTWYAMGVTMNNTGSVVFFANAIRETRSGSADFTGITSRLGHIGAFAPLQATVELVGISRAYWSDGDIASFVREPYAMFQPLRRRTFSFAEAGGAAPTVGSRLALLGVGV